jgi:ABC-2 type transport system permease protein
MVILKGSTLSDIKPQLLAMGGFAVVFNGWAVWNYRKRS